MVMMAWGYFYLLAGIALLILPEYTEVLNIDRAEASVLMGVMGVAIGVGCATAGLISGHHIEPRLIPIGAAGLIIFFVLLAAVPPSLPDLRPMVRVALSNVAFFVLGAGFFAGSEKLSGDEEVRVCGRTVHPVNRQQVAALLQETDRRRNIDLLEPDRFGIRVAGCSRTVPCRIGPGVPAGHLNAV